MLRIVLFLLLFSTYVIYSAVVYSKGTENAVSVDRIEAGKINHGKKLYQQYNCTACHQIYGLGGYLGPELTTAQSDPNRGENFMKALLKGGGPRMPNFHFTDDEINAVISYLKYVDATAVTYKKPTPK
ncbi:MAG: cytochrome c [Chitinophagaceae bacterium]|nr:cytochrome c [Chitinophagaceae bacterium]MBK9569701.1 cytochrome c [Chitinophagaceae bacterium]MBL0271852.1 cytochrome c [Chitinophagaceae bacterium]